MSPVIVDYEPARHRNFVLSSFAHGAGEPQSELESLLHHGQARCKVFVGAGNPDLFVGWAAVVASNPQVVVWAFTKWTPGGVARRRGVMRFLLGALGTDVAAPMIALYPSPACLALIERGWPITVAGDSNGNAEDRSKARD